MAPQSSDHSGVYCSDYHRAVELIGRRWTGVILLALKNGVERFSEIRAAIPGLSDRLLSERLRELEDEGLVTRAEDHGQVRYRLTEKGEALSPVLDQLNSWVDEWGRADATTSSE